METSLFWRQFRTLLSRTTKYLSWDGISSNFNNNDFAAGSSLYNNESKANNSAILYHALLINPRAQERACPRSSPSPDRRNLPNIRSHHRSDFQHHPRPVFGLSHRFIAFASPHPPRAQALRPLLPWSRMSPCQQVLVPWEWGYQRHRQRSGTPLSGLEGACSAGCGHSCRLVEAIRWRVSAGGVVGFFSCSAPLEGVVGEREDEHRRERRYSSRVQGCRRCLVLNLALCVYLRAFRFRREGWVTG